MKKIIGLFICLLVWAYGAPLSAQETRFSNDLGMEFVLIPAGSFIMGMNSGSHNVNISQPFYLGAYEVTQEQWDAVMADNPSQHKGKRNPVEQVSWNDVQAFIDKLNQNESRGKYRLPTEAEWEYAARAGTGGAYFFGDDADSLDEYAWYGGNSAGISHPVGQKRPNPWGLYDVYGNVWEWVQDQYGEKSGPQGPSQGAYRVMRGGGWSNIATNCQSSFRHYYTPDGRFACLGLRLAFSPMETE